MPDVMHMEGESDIARYDDELVEFKKDIHRGLNKDNKYIYSKYFYDELGSDLFNQITRHPDYYLTQCEINILNHCKYQLSMYLKHHAFNLIELGPGEGIKTNILIQQFLVDDLTFRYTPIDISMKYLKTLIKKFSTQLPDKKLTPIHGDYFRGLEWQSDHSHRKNLVLFLGSSIGNFDFSATNNFLHHLWQTLHDGDFVLLGFDLRKDIDILLRAYSDSDGITREFNLNLLKRINRELQANFDLSKFRHYPTYNVYSGAMESYLVSVEKQTVYMQALDSYFNFEAIEPIHVEYSHKYHLSQIENFAKNNGFEIVHHFFDNKYYFVDTLWQVKK